MASSTHQKDRIDLDRAAVSSLIAQFTDHHGMRRREARLKLVEMGKPVVPALIEALSHRKDQVRWEAAKALSQIGDPSAAPALVNTLEDENFGVRWLAAEGLIAAGRKGLQPLLQALVHRSNSIWLREGAHHVLRSLVGEPRLHDLIAPVLAALDDVEPVVEVPPAAERALDALADKPRRSPR